MVVRTMKGFKPPRLDKETKRKIKPYWKEFLKLENKFRENRYALQEKMNKQLNLGINLEFFYVDGECVGIGAENFKDRKKFPLLQHEDLEEK